MDPKDIHSYTPEEIAEFVASDRLPPELFEAVVAWYRSNRSSEDVKQAIVDAFVWEDYDLSPCPGAAPVDRDARRAAIEARIAEVLAGDAREQA